MFRSGISSVINLSRTLFRSTITISGAVTIPSKTSQAARAPKQRSDRGTAYRQVVRGIVIRGVRAAGS